MWNTITVRNNSRELNGIGTPDCIRWRIILNLFDFFFPKCGRNKKFNKLLEKTREMIILKINRVIYLLTFERFVFIKTKQPLTD